VGRHGVSRSRCDGCENTRRLRRVNAKRTPSLDRGGARYLDVEREVPLVGAVVSSRRRGERSQRKSGVEDARPLRVRAAIVLVLDRTRVARSVRYGDQPRPRHPADRELEGIHPPRSTWADGQLRLFPAAPEFQERRPLQNRALEQPTARRRTSATTSEGGRPRHTRATRDVRGRTDPPNKYASTGVIQWM